MTEQSYAVANGFFGLGLEAVRGTAAATPRYLRVKDPKHAPMITWLKSEGLEGSPVDTYDMTAGVRHEDFDLKGDVILDSFPLLLIGALGSADAIAGSGPYTHTDGLLNDWTVGSQPPSLTVIDFDGVNGHTVRGAMVDTLEITHAIDAALVYTAKLMGQADAVVSRPTPSFGVEPMIPAWNATTVINGVTVTVMEDFTCKIERKAEAQHTGGNQFARTIFAGSIGVTGKMTFVVETTAESLVIGGGSSPEWNTAAGGAGLQRLQVPMLVTFTEPVTSHSLELQMSTVQFHNPVIERNKKYLTVSADYEAVANTTDAISTGSSPLKTVTTNAVATAYAGS